MAARPPRRNDTGLIRPYRPKPDDFRVRYIEMGWDGLDEHYRCNWRCIRRWIMEEGREQLRAARAAAVAAGHRKRRAARTCAAPVATARVERATPSTGAAR